MNAVELARTAYAPSNTAIRTAQSTEYEALARVTRQLKAKSGQSGGYIALVQALHENRRLWSLLAVNVADPENALPDDLRARLVYLAEFTNHATSKVLAREMPVDALIDINLAVMAGLRAQGTTQ